MVYLFPKDWELTKWRSAFRSLSIAIYKMLIDIISIPVYRLTELQYKDEMNRYGNSALGTIPWSMRNAIKSPFKEEILNCGYSEFGIWKYNEIIGFIELHFLGDQIRAEYWSSVNKLKRRSRTKIFKWKTYKLVPESAVSDIMDNRSILLAMTKYLEECKKILKGCYVDDNKFIALSECVDWVKYIRAKKISAKKNL